MSNPKKLLIIEDDPLLAELMADYCEEIGVTPLRAADGAEGLRLAAEQTPDAATVDHRLPDMKGLEILARLKENPATRNIPLFFLSADARLHENEARSRGAVEILMKPVPETVLRAALERHLGPL
jgi:tubulin-specific chaperone A